MNAQNYCAVNWKKNVFTFSALLVYSLSEYSNILLYLAENKERIRFSFDSCLSQKEILATLRQHEKYMNWEVLD